MCITSLSAFANQQVHFELHGFMKSWPIISTNFTENSSTYEPVSARILIISVVVIFIDIIIIILIIIIIIIIIIYQSISYSYHPSAFSDLLYN